MLLCAILVRANDQQYFAISAKLRNKYENMALLALKNQIKTIYLYSKIKYYSQMETMIQPPEFDRLAFTVLAIEASAKKMGISPSEMRRRLDKVGLIKSLIQDCYDTLHTESREAVANEVVEALKNWERVE